MDTHPCCLWAIHQVIDRQITSGGLCFGYPGTIEKARLEQVQALDLFLESVEHK
jgi:hypothetical protein